MSNMQPAIKTTKTPAIKTRKVAYPRLYNAIEDVVKEAGLDPTLASINDLYDALEAAIVKDARGL